MVPHEDDFIANVDPHIPHLRWSQGKEQMIGPNERVPAQYLNGDERWVDPLYG